MILAKKNTNITIIQNIDIKEVPLTEFTTPLMSCNCINRGFCVTTIGLSQTKYFLGESCKVAIFVDNSQSRVNINSIECIL